MVIASFFGHMLTPKLIAETTWELIEEFEVIGVSQNSKTFTLSPAIDFDDVSMLVLISDFSLTAGSGAFTFIVNGITNGWFSDGRRILGGVETIIDVNGGSFTRLVTDLLLTSNNVPAHLIAYIQLNKGGANTRVGIQSFANGVGVNGNEVLSHTNTNNITSISSIKVTGRIRNFDVGTRMSLYKVKR